MKCAKEAIQWASEYLRARGVESPIMDSHVLLADTLGVDRLSLLRRPEASLAPEQMGKFREVVRRRGNREPLPYLLGKREFMSLEFAVSPHTLIPRPETEILVEAVIERAQRISTPDHQGASGCLAADIGTGCGVIAIALALHLPNAQIYATDISHQALAEARHNCQRHRVAERVTLSQGDLLTPLAEFGLVGKLDFLAANLPYVARQELENLIPEIAEFEPRIALEGGEDGLDIYRQLLPAAIPYLKPSGFLAIEVGKGQADKAADLAGSAGFGDLEIIRDYADIERVVIGWAREGS